MTHANNQNSLLHSSLLFLHMKELRELALKLYLVDKGNKKQLIHRICHYVTTGERLALPKIPKESKAKANKHYPLKANTLMLKGAYKNDLKTRDFFKSLIGSHFHFTAYGIDWLNERWFEGNPPTYQEFAQMWSQEYEKRKLVKAPPKEEWAYINFVQEYLAHSPEATREILFEAWKNERERQKERAYSLLDSHLKKTK